MSTRLFCALCLSLSLQVMAQEGDPFEGGGRHISARIIPVPTTVSPEMQRLIARPLNPLTRFVPKSHKDWQAIIAKHTEYAQNSAVAEARGLFPMEIVSQEMGGVKVYVITPPNIPEENRNRVLINAHGGGYIFNKAEGCLPEALAMAHYGKYKVISIDYRMPPEHPFPAALDDGIAVYLEVLKSYKPEQIALFGTSAGGGLIGAMIFKLRELNVPLPGAMGLGTPWSDLTTTGDTYFTNEEIDDVIVTPHGILGSIAKLYAGVHDMKHPHLSPVYGDYSKGFPPSILTSGTRDMFLSCTVRMHRKLREAGVVADLHVFEGMSHAFYMQQLDAPESKEVFYETARFFNKHLSR